MPLYKTNPNDGNKQVPNSTGRGYKQLAGFSINPPETTKVQTPTYVVVNKTGTFAFSYLDQTTGASTSSYITGAFVQSANAGATKLDINPVKWRRTDAASVTGDITFVYRRQG